MEVSGSGVPTVTLWPQVEPHRGCHLGEDLTSVGIGWPQAQLQSHIATGHSQSYSYTLATGTVTVTPGNTLRQIQGPWRWLFSDTHVLCHPWLLSLMSTVTHIYCHTSLLSHMALAEARQGLTAQILVRYQTGITYQLSPRYQTETRYSTPNQIPDRESLQSSQLHTRPGLTPQLTALILVRYQTGTHSPSLSLIPERYSMLNS